MLLHGISPDDQFNRALAAVQHQTIKLEFYPVHIHWQAYSAEGRQSGVANSSYNFITWGHKIHINELASDDCSA